MTHDATRPDGAPDPIPFGRFVPTGREFGYLRQALDSRSVAGGGSFTRRCERWLERQLGAHRALITHSCTAALEMAAMLCDIGPGDEVIMPSFTFSSTATAFVLRGATPVFVDVRPDTLNLDETLIEPAVTSRTRAIVPVHYAGVACEMADVMDVASRHGLRVIEDAAQGHLSHHDGRALGAIGDLGCLSFHETKNIVSGEGGALIVNDPTLVERAEIIRDKGTDRSRFLRGEIDKYTWVDVGSSYGPGEVPAAFLLAQLEQSDAIDARRRALYAAYRRALAPLAETGRIRIPSAGPDRANGHIFWLVVRDGGTRDALIEFLAERRIGATFHYVPLHSAPAGLRYGRTCGSMAVTDEAGARLVRLPLHGGLADSDVARVVDAVVDFHRRAR